MLASAGIDYLMVTLSSGSIAMPITASQHCRFPSGDRWLMLFERAGQRVKRFRFPTLLAATFFRP